MKIGTPQLRVLLALQGGKIYTREGLCQLIGISPTAGTLNLALNGRKVSKGNPRAEPGLLERGLIAKLELDVDGVKEVRYRITVAGTIYLALERSKGRGLPKLRGRTISTNRRYRGNVEEAPRESGYVIPVHQVVPL